MQRVPKIVIICAILALPGCDKRESAWKKAEKESSLAAYEGFLMQYPEGAHAEEAKGRIDQINWAEASASANREAYKSYLKRFPGGRFAREASSAIEHIEWRRAAELDAIAAYRAYLEDYPEGVHAIEAEAGIKFLTLLQAGREAHQTGQWSDALGSLQAAQKLRRSEELSRLILTSAEKLAVVRMEERKEQEWNHALRSGDIGMLRKYYKTYRDQDRFEVLTGDVKAVVSGEGGGGMMRMQFQRLEQPFPVNKDSVKVKVVIEGRPDLAQEMNPREAKALKLMTYQYLGPGGRGASTITRGRSEQTVEYEIPPQVLAGELPARTGVRIVLCIGGECDGESLKGKIIDILEVADASGAEIGEEQK